MGAKQLLEWEAYASLEPFGEMRADYRAALVAQTVFNMAVEKRYKRPLDDFLLFKDKEERRQSPEEQLSLLNVLAIIHSGDEDTKPDKTPGAVSMTPEVAALLMKARAAMK